MNIEHAARLLRRILGGIALSYSLEAVIGAYDAIRAAARPWLDARVARLEAGLALLPLTEKFVAGLSPRLGPAASEPVANFPDFTTPLSRWLREAARNATLAYVGAEYFGGTGTQWAVAMRHGAITLGPLKGGGAINQVLRLLGVTSAPDSDEFDAVGLGAHRATEDWA